MSKKPRIISIDGTRGIGKTTQAGLLALYFKRIGVNCKIFKVNTELTFEFYETNKKINSFLEESESNVAIMDGSLAKIVQSDIIGGSSIEEIMEKYRFALHEYAVMFHKYAMANILISIEDIAKCKERCEKNKTYLDIENPYNDDNFLEKETLVMKGLSNINNHVITKDIKLYNLYTDNDENILSVHNRIINFLETEFILPRIKLDNIIQ